MVSVSVSGKAAVVMSGPNVSIESNFPPFEIPEMRVGPSPGKIYGRMESEVDSCYENRNARMSWADLAEANQMEAAMAERDRKFKEAGEPVDSKEFDDELERSLAEIERKFDKFRDYVDESADYSADTAIMRHVRHSDYLGRVATEKAAPYVARSLQTGLEAAKLMEEATGTEMENSVIAVANGLLEKRGGLLSKAISPLLGYALKSSSRRASEKAKEAEHLLSVSRAADGAAAPYLFQAKGYQELSEKLAAPVDVAVVYLI